MRHDATRNPTNARVIAEGISFRINSGIPPGDIAVLCLFESQVSCIGQAMEEISPNSLLFDNLAFVGSYRDMQGWTKPVLVYDLVITEGFDMGFRSFMTGAGNLFHTASHGSVITLIVGDILAIRTVQETHERPGRLLRYLLDLMISKGGSVRISGIAFNNPSQGFMQELVTARSTWATETYNIAAALAYQKHRN